MIQEIFRSRRLTLWLVILVVSAGLMFGYYYFQHSQKTYQQYQIRMEQIVQEQRKIKQELLDLNQQLNKPDEVLPSK